MECKNTEYIAIFDSYGGSLPDGCPEDFVSAGLKQPFFAGQN